MRLAVRRVPFAVRGADTQAEAAGYADARVVVVEIREHRLDLVADAVVISEQHVPVDRKSVAQGKSLSVRVDSGGRWITKNKHTYTQTYLIYTHKYKTTYRTNSY